MFGKRPVDGGGEGGDGDNLYPHRRDPSVKYGNKVQRDRDLKEGVKLTKQDIEGIDEIAFKMAAIEASQLKMAAVQMARELWMPLALTEIRDGTGEYSGEDGINMDRFEMLSRACLDASMVFLGVVNGLEICLADDDSDDKEGGCEK